MTNADFWASMNAIIQEGFTTEGLHKLDYYAELFDTRRLVYQRFSPAEQYGCSAGGSTHVIASLLAGAEAGADTSIQSGGEDFKEQCKRGKKQETVIEAWAKATGCWFSNVEKSLSSQLGAEIAEGGEAKVYDHGATLVKAIGLDYYVEPILALDRISLHNAFFQETTLTVLGFGRDANGDFKIIVEQPFIEGHQPSDSDIAVFMEDMGFLLVNPRNWTFATPNIYLSDMHDENVIVSESNVYYVVDCDIRINTPSLRCGGTRQLTTKVSIIDP